MRFYTKYVDIEFRLRPGHFAVGIEFDSVEETINLRLPFLVFSLYFRRSDWERAAGSVV